MSKENFKSKRKSNIDDIYKLQEKKTVLKLKILEKSKDAA